MNKPIYICGPTASGKSALAIELAIQLDGEIVNADAYQLYRGLEIISAAPSPSELAQAPHHLYGALQPHELCDAMQFREMARVKIDEIQDRGKLPIVTGGSGLYLKFLSHGPSPVPSGDETLRKELESESDEALADKLILIDPKGAAATNLKNRRYVIRALEICILSGRKMSDVKSDWKQKSEEVELHLQGGYLQWDRDELRARISLRVDQMLADGAIEEVAAIKNPSATCEKAIGVPQIQSYLSGTMDLDACRDKIVIATHQYAKRQRTWFGKEKWLTPCHVDHTTDIKKLASKLGQQLRID
ncbi:MAG: tRNA (adenosine(37)-N6)-dimethylallyltransferase MiaA [Akkermansiaceae bacterium]|nr:tRNA (adenosine(37)-N6)-dimethylallyltransferase MiaA [Akkermansiaceae bacterium]